MICRQLMSLTCFHLHPRRPQRLPVKRSQSRMQHALTHRRQSRLQPHRVIPQSFFGPPQGSVHVSRHCEFRFIYPRPILSRHLCWGVTPIVHRVSRQRIERFFVRYLARFDHGHIGGPRALRTPENLDGIPGLSPDDLTKLQESFTMLSRVVSCLRLVFLSGGHVHLEQPTNAMSWLEPIVRSFLKLISASCVCIAACQYGMDIAKSWIFASSFKSLCSLACSCAHPMGTHTRVQGTRDSSGQFLSRITACYPSSLAEAFASVIAPLISQGHSDLNLDSASATIPWKFVGQFPKSFEDGGGLISHPDWSDGPRLEHDCFKPLRQTWLQRIVQLQLHKQVLVHFSQARAYPPFSDDQLEPFRKDLIEWLNSLNRKVDWTIRAHQPMHLAVMAELSSIMHDADVALFPCLQEGVSTGFLGDIPKSHVFPLKDNSPPDSAPLSVHMQNWQSAEADLDLTRELVSTKDGSLNSLGTFPRLKPHTLLESLSASSGSLPPILDRHA